MHDQKNIKLLKKILYNLSVTTYLFGSIYRLYYYYIQQLLTQDHHHISPYQKSGKINSWSRSRWPRLLRGGSAAACVLGIAGLNSDLGMEGCLLRLLCVVR